MIKKRVLGIDYGQKRIGVAISDKLRLFASPYKTYINDGDPEFIHTVKEIIDREDIGTIVVGLPFHEDGTPSSQTKAVLSFIDRIKSSLSIEVVSYDERYSSLEAKSVISANNRRKQNRSTKSCIRDKEKIDQIAASIILQNYLDMINV